MHALKPSSQAIINNNGIYNLPCCIPRSSHSWSPQRIVCVMKNRCYSNADLVGCFTFSFTSSSSIYGSSFTASARCCLTGILVMRKYTEKRNADGYTVILSVSNPSPSNIYGSTAPKNALILLVQPHLGSYNRAVRDFCRRIPKKQPMGYAGISGLAKNRHAQTEEKTTVRKIF